MRDMKLQPPVIEQAGGYVKVVLKHEALATPEEIIVKYLQDNAQITNRIARELCFYWFREQDVAIQIPANQLRERFPVARMRAVSLTDASGIPPGHTDREAIADLDIARSKG